MVNRLNHKNVVETQKKDCNACEDFMDNVNAGLVISAALAMFNRITISNNPPDTCLHDI